MEAISSPAVPPRLRLVSANRQLPQRGVADMHVGLELETGAATHLIDGGGEAVPTPQALRNVLADADVRRMLAQHKQKILAAMGAEDTSGEGRVELLLSLLESRADGAVDNILDDCMQHGRHAHMSAP